MIVLDMKTVIFSQTATGFLCAVVIGFLWYRNRDRFAGLAFILADYVFQVIGIFLILMRGRIPDFLSLVVSNILILAGLMAIYAGLQRFVGKPGSQAHNYGFLAVFALGHGYFALIQPNLAARSFMLSLAILTFTSQCLWLLLRKVAPPLRPLTRGLGLVFGSYALVSIFRAIGTLSGPLDDLDLFKSGPRETLFVMAYQLLFIIQTYSLILLVNRRLLQEVAGQEERFAKAFHSSPYAITLTRLADGKIFEVNQGFVGITGYQTGEVIGKTSLELGLWIREEDRQTAARVLLGEQQVQGMEFEFRKKNGERMTGLFSAHNLIIGNERCVLSSINDITRRKSAEELVRIRLRLFEFAVDHSLEELLQKTLDEVGVLTESPIGFYHFLEKDQQTLSLQAWSTRTVREFCTAVGSGSHYPIDQAGVWMDCVYKKKPVIHNDYSALSHRKGMPAGHAEVLRELVVPIQRAGRIVAILGIGNKPADYTEKDVEIVSYLADVAWEIVERKRAEDAIRNLNAELEQRVEERTGQLKEAQEKLIRQERLAVLGQLAGSVGHELRNPLAVLSNAVYFLKMALSDADKKIKEYLDILSSEIGNADKIIGDLLDFTRLQFADRQLLAPVHLVSAALQRFPGPPEVAVEVEVPNELPTVYADPRQMIQVLGNLIQNAFQAMAGGGTLTLTGRLEGETVMLAVSDSGQGIPPENLAKVFDPLFTTKPRGIGLGLAVCRSLVEANGGRIEVRSEPGQGATFSVFLPEPQGESHE